LRTGDVVATRDGFLAYSGAGRGEHARFTPIDAQRGLSEDVRRRLAETKVDPVDAPASRAADLEAPPERIPAAHAGRNKRAHSGGQ
jgi:hypothetical protein